MSSQPVARKSKRLAASYEQDDDFIFTRTSKRAKPSVEPEPEPEKKPKKAVGRPRQSAGRKRALSPVEQEPTPPPPAATSRRTTRRSSANGPKNGAKHLQEDEDQLVVTKTRTTRRTVRSSLEGKEEGGAPAPPDAKSRKTRKRDISPVGTPAGPALNHLTHPTSDHRDDEEAEDTADAEASESRQIALPISDTPVIARNKELRKNGGQRRSSLGMRGRRASNLIENGHIAAPHREVGPAEFYKHIEAEGLPEPRRMRQLLTWCGERSLLEKPGLGVENSNAILGARAIQDLLLKDFASRSEFSDWFAREDARVNAEPAEPVELLPNPKNIEHEEKIVELEAKVKRLKEERAKWRSISKFTADLPPLFPSPDADTDATNPPLPDASLLAPEEAQILSTLTEPTTSFPALQEQLQTRIRGIHSSLEFSVDSLASNIHKLDQRVLTASREAERVLGLSTARLKDREEKEKTAAGTRDMPGMEVLRSLSRILPEGGT